MTTNPSDLKERAWRDPVSYPPPLHTQVLVALREGPLGRGGTLDVACYIGKQDDGTGKQIDRWILADIRLEMRQIYRWMPISTVAEVAEQAERISQLEQVLVHTAASLAATISLLERGGKTAKKAAPSDKMFDQMLVDYRNALEAAREALGRTCSARGAAGGGKMMADVTAEMIDAAQAVPEPIFLVDGSDDYFAAVYLAMKALDPDFQALEHKDDALREARDKFREYAKSHADKAHHWLPDAEFNERLRKSDRNREMAERMEAALQEGK